MHPKAILLTVIAIGTSAMVTALLRHQNKAAVRDRQVPGIHSMQTNTRGISPAENNPDRGELSATSGDDAVLDDRRPARAGLGSCGKTAGALAAQVISNDVAARPRRTAMTGISERASRNPGQPGTPPSGHRSFLPSSKTVTQLPTAGDPVILTDPGSILPADPSRDAALLESAKQLIADLGAPGLNPDTPEYLAHWNRTVDLSNQLLRQRFGGQVWVAHHIQSHHLKSHPAAAAR